MSIQIRRKALKTKELDGIGGALPHKEPTLEDLKTKLKSKKVRWGKVVNKYFPITDWLLHYKFREDFMADIIAGITIAIMNIPQGMAYALLANVPPVYGLYTSIFPVIIYCIFGPSKHISMGTNPLTSILTATAISNFASGMTQPPESEKTWGSLFYRQKPAMLSETENFMIATALSLLVGCWQILFSLLKFGKLSWILSDVLVSGYTTAAAFHVLVSQLEGIFGFEIEEPQIVFAKIIQIVINLFKDIKETNFAALIFSVVCIAVLVFNDEYLKPKIAKKCSIPVPIQLIVVAFGTLISYLMNAKEEYNLDVVGNFSDKGPQVGRPEIGAVFTNILAQSIIIAIVGYCVTLSMAKIYANKFSYKVDGNQELLSEGLSNLFGSFFQCIPSGASMSRTSVQVAVGGRTQLTSIVSVSILFVVIFSAGFLFEELPKAILSAIIVVALKGMFMQFHDLPVFYKKSKLDAALWVGTFIAVILVDIDYGLVVGIGLSVILLIYRSIGVTVEELGSLDTTEFFASRKQYRNANRKENTIILKINGPITFANFEDILEGLRRKLKRIPKTATLTHLILEMTQVAYIDQSAAKAFKDWLKKDAKEYKKTLAGCNFDVNHMLKMFDLSDDIFFPSTYDAIGIHEEEIGGGEEGPDGQVFTVTTTFPTMNGSTRGESFGQGLYRQISIS